MKIVAVRETSVVFLSTEILIWPLANVGVKVRNKNETAKPFGNFYDLLAFRLV